jgi:zinc transport system ATP-binding protein
MPETPLVNISHLDFAYRDSLVLKHVHLPVEPRSTLGIIGPNGGGKTTLLRLLLGLLTPTRGTITIDGLPPGKAVARGDTVGYLPQNPAITPQFPLSVRQVITLGLAGKTGMLRPYDRADLGFVEHLIDRVGLSELGDRPVSGLSGGQLQRVLIARALAPRPKLLVLDEPTTGVDSAGQQKFIDFLQELKRELALTVMIVSHDLRTVSAISDRIACLNVNLHYHDVPHRLPRELAHQLFACDLEAMGIDKAPDHACPACDAVDAAVSLRPVTHAPPPVPFQITNVK